MADRTANTVFYPSTDPKKIAFKANVQDADTITIPFGLPDAILGMNSEDTTDVVTRASFSGGTITFNMINVAGSAIASRTDVVGEILLRQQ